MEDVYSLTLLAAVICAGSSVVIGIARRHRAPGASGSRRWLTAGRRAGAAGIVLASFALLLHYVADHGSGAPNTMRLLQFAMAHPAPFAAVAASATGVRLCR